MIQRIQSIFLLLAAASGFGVLALPFASTNEGVQSSTLFSDKVYSINDNIGLLVLFAVAGALSIAAIFLFNNRQLQMKIGRIALVSNILGIILATILFWQDLAGIGTSAVEDGLGGYLPFLFIIFSALALRAIKKDETLVRSADRLR
ncbi:MAG: DUF4293 domain-containing protein [Saprospiraceae bacterium]|nr:DUF4293 domain-containing protein [Saprospiraceae bacterium]MCF8250817.1 DUF4293 domain-containing protein [Saprospiraceae bacterium]MCF8281432.1 DUF4293 domain-containing protein [Bacteroidales bacterium]MCF8312618.1 DUF4293 domain-containing protein [Saprospiraceae bacterium]MCF8441008.1 DUF4293 domain-containing protein [Saprospiraceae bacterium]